MGFGKRLCQWLPGRGRACAFPEPSEEREWDTAPPIASAIHPNAFTAVNFHHVDGEPENIWIQDRVSCLPKTGVQNELDRMLLDMIDNDPAGLDPRVAFEHINDESRPFQFIFEMRSMNEDHLIVAGRQINMFLQNLHFVPAVLVEPNLTDPEYGWSIQKFRDDCDHFFRELYILRFFRVDAEPREMRKAEFCGALRFMFRELAKIIIKSMHRTAIETGPKCRFTDRLAASRYHIQIIVGDSTYHVTVWLDVAHSDRRWLRVKR